MRQSTRAFWTIGLDDPLATVPDRAGARAADLARAISHDMPVPPGFVIPVQCVDHHEPYADTGDLRAAWARLSRDGARPLIVRPSPVPDDGPPATSASVPDVREWADFRRAVDEVTASATGPGTMAVLVQPQLDAVSGGVVLGADPVDGRTDRTTVFAASGPPRTRTGRARYRLTRRGRLIDADDAAGGPLTEPQLRRLAWLAARTNSVFGGPQDVEFAFGHDDRLWILQIRPSALPALAPVPPPAGGLPGRPIARRVACLAHRHH